MVKRLMRFLAALTAAMLAALGLAQPASAAGSWQPISWTGSMPCSPTGTIDGLDVEFQACTVTSGNYMQIVAVVVNHSNQTVTISAALDSYIDEGSDLHQSCGDAALGPGVRRGCYGSTRYIPCGSKIGGWTVISIEDVPHQVDAPEHSHC